MKVTDTIMELVQRPFIHEVLVRHTQDAYLRITVVNYKPTGDNPEKRRTLERKFKLAEYESLSAEAWAAAIEAIADDFEEYLDKEDNISVLDLMCRNYAKEHGYTGPDAFRALCEDYFMGVLAAGNPIMAIATKYAKEAAYATKDRLRKKLQECGAAYIIADVPIVLP